MGPKGGLGADWPSVTLKVIWQSYNTECRRLLRPKRTLVFFSAVRGMTCMHFFPCTIFLGDHTEKLTDYIVVAVVTGSGSCSSNSSILLSKLYHSTI